MISFLIGGKNIEKLGTVCDNRECFNKRIEFTFSVHIGCAFINLADYSGLADCS